MATPIKEQKSVGINIKNGELKEQYHPLGAYTNLFKNNITSAIYDGTNVLITTKTGKTLVIPVCNFKGLELE
jgi:hypothetical protein